MALAASKKSCTDTPARPRAGAGGPLAAVDHVDVEVDIDDLAQGRQALQLLDHDIDQTALAALAGGANADPCGFGLFMSATGVGEGCEADLADPTPVHAVIQQRLDRIAVGQALVRVAQVEMGVQRQDADAVQPQSVNARPGDGVVAADQNGQVAMGLRRHGVAHGLEGVERRDGLQRHIANIMDLDI
jgi:hypothetical protein